MQRQQSRRSVAFGAIACSASLWLRDETAKEGSAASDSRTAFIRHAAEDCVADGARRSRTLTGDVCRSRRSAFASQPEEP